MGEREPALVKTGEAQWQCMPGQQGGGAGQGGQIPGRADRPERRGEAALRYGPAIRARGAPSRLRPESRRLANAHPTLALVYVRSSGGLWQFIEEQGARKHTFSPVLTARRIPLRFPSPQTNSAVAYPSGLGARTGHTVKATYCDETGLSDSAFSSGSIIFDGMLDATGSHAAIGLAGHCRKCSFGYHLRNILRTKLPVPHRRREQRGGSPHLPESQS